MPQDYVVYGGMEFFRGFRKLFQEILDKQKMIQVNRIGELQEGVTYKLISLAEGDAFHGQNLEGKTFKIEPGPFRVVAKFDCGSRPSCFVPGFTVEVVESETSPDTAPPLGTDFYHGLVAGPTPAPLAGCGVDPRLSIRDLTYGRMYRLISLAVGDVWAGCGLEGLTFRRNGDGTVTFDGADEDVRLHDGFLAESVDQEPLVTPVWSHISIDPCYIAPELKYMHNTLKDTDQSTDDRKAAVALRRALVCCIEELERRVTKDYGKEPDKYKYLIEGREVLRKYLV